MILCNPLDILTVIHNFYEGKKEGMCPFYFSFSDQCIIKGQPTYMPLIEQRINFCLTDQYTECERYKSFSENPHFCAMERREYRRVLKQLKGLIYSPEKRADIETVDISLGGARLTSTAYIRPGECVDITIKEENGEEFDARACVRWASPQEGDGKWIMGVQFNPMPEGKAMSLLERIVWKGDVT